jgi:signal transduction histidine kinase
MLTSDPSRLTPLYDAIRSLGSPLDVSEALDRTLDVAMQLVNAERGLSLLLRALDPKLKLCAVPGLDDETAQQAATVMELLAGQVKQTGHGLLIPDTQNDPRFEQVASSFASRTALLAPLHAGDETIGTLYMDRMIQVGPFTPDDLALLEILANVAAVIIQNAQQHEALRRANAEFVSVLVHDLRTPMTTIKGYSDLLIRGVIKKFEDEQKFLAVILNDVDRMNALLSGYSDVTRIEAGRLRIELEAVDIAACINEILDRASPPGDHERKLITLGVHAEYLIGLHYQIEAKGQTLTIRLPPLPPVRADKYRLIQVIANLLRNAHKYTPPGGHITLTGQAQDEFVRLSVADTGIGISPPDQEKLFHVFFRADAPIVQEQPGWGLGLYIAGRLVELFGGEIGVESEVGCGSTVWFTLPIATSECETPLDV